MESIRININKQLTGEGLLPIISYPTEAAYDFRIHGCTQDMQNLGANRAFELRVYPDGRNLQMSLIDTIEGGFIQYAVLIDSSRVMVPADHLLKALRDLSKAYLSLAANDPKPSANKPFINAVADIRSKLALDTRTALPRLLPTPDSGQHSPLTYFMNFKSDGELISLLDYPDQEFFHDTASVYLLADGIQPATSPSLRRVESIVMRAFKILSPDGYEYGEVKEGETTRINLRGKEGMLPLTIDVKGDVTKPTRYGYFDSATNSIRIDERTIKFYNELRFVVHFNGRMLRSCTVRYNGEQVMPDSNGNYLIKVYEDRLNDAGAIQFSGYNLKDAEIVLTPGIVKQGEYVFTPEPKHDLTMVTLDFGDGRPIKTHFDIGTNDRLFNQLQSGKVKGYKVKREGDEYKMFIPRKLSLSSKNILRMMKGVMMVAATLVCYALACQLFTHHWPWPLSPNGEATTLVDNNEDMGEDPDSAVYDPENEDNGLIVDKTDQVTLQQLDQAYLKTHDVWRRDSIRSSKYTDIINTIYNGRISEIKMKGIDGKVITNGWWEQIWRNIIMPSSVNHQVAKQIFEEVSADHNTLDVMKLYEELSKKIHPSPDGMSVPGYQPKPSVPTPAPAATTPQATPTTPQQGAAGAKGAQQGVTAPKTKGMTGAQQGMGTPKTKGVTGAKTKGAKSAYGTYPVTAKKSKKTYAYYYGTKNKKKRF
ncbi:MAG: hypothetical protein J5637_08880 [Prevotella sp.]|nr:hypothetical protein [Prevotella sp.]